MNEDLRVDIGRRLRESRRFASLTQGEVAEEFGIVRQLVSAWECGRSQPTSDQWYRLSPLYGVSLDYLVYGVRTIPVSRYAVMEKVFERPGVQPPAAAFGTPERLPTS